VLEESVQFIQHERWAQGNSYFVFVGSLHPRKNIEGLLEAFALYRASGGEASLVVVGSSMWTEEMRQVPCVHWVGRLEQDDLALVMGGALGLVYLPWFEGFGVPIVEAFAAGIPVIASNVTSIPEVCGGAEVALVSPNDAAAAAQWMLRIETDSTLRDAAVERGLRRAQDFSWERSAELLWKSIQRLLPA
jgi:glycosyltransferase involved in cell wall biosynthesis